MFVTPRKAATVALIKDSSGEIEVLLMKRHQNDRFLPDYYVFPGGAVDSQDHDISITENTSQNITGNIEKVLYKDFDGDKNKYFGYIMCGIRETFEESGILLASNEHGKYPVIETADSITKFGNYRKLVFEKKISFSKMLADENLIPAIDNFFYMNRWITPPLFPIRYDTRFFAAAVPENQEISHDGNELVDFEWVTPANALKKYKDNKIKLVMPTIKTIEFLQKFKSTNDLILHFKTI